jgi:hypothetical protein
LPYKLMQHEGKLTAYKIADDGNVAEIAAPLLSQVEAGYVATAPTADRACANCYFWQDGACLLVEPTPTPITESGVCNEWVKADAALDDAETEPAPPVTEVVVAETTQTVERTVLHEIAQVTEFKGKAPEIPTFSDVDVDALTKGDADPVYIRMRIAEVGRVSRNGILYDQSLLSEIARQIHEKRVGGNRGHIPESERDTAMPIAEILWIGAVQDKNVLWGKAYVRDKETARYIKDLKAVGSKLGSSIWGDGIVVPVHAAASGVGVSETKRGIRRFTDFVLEKIDLAPSERASLDMGGYFEVTSEMTDQDNQQGTLPMAENLTPESVLEQLDDAALERVVEMYMKRKGKKVVAAEFAANVETDRVQITELTTQTTRLERENASMRETIAEFESREFKSGLEALINDAFNPKTKSADDEAAVASVRHQLRREVVSELAGKNDLKMADALIRQVMVSDGFRPIAETVVRQIAGGNAVTGVQQQNDPVRVRMSAGSDLLEKMGMKAGGE